MSIVDSLRSCHIFSTLNDSELGKISISEESLVSFTRFFLEVCLDQIYFMEKLMQPDSLRIKIL